MDYDAQELRDNFDRCDANGDGNIQFEEFASLLTNIGAETSAEEAQVGFSEIDSNKDGVISYDEFVGWWTDL